MKYKKLGDICEIVTGTTPKSHIKEYWNGNLKWITPAELTDSSFVISDTERHITEEAVKKSGLKPFPKGTVLLSSRAPIGKVAIAGCEMYCNQGFKNLICSDEIYNVYLYFFLKSKTDYLNSLGRGATFKEISKSIVENIQIPLPDLPQQHRIVANLDKISHLISLRQSQLSQLDTLVKAKFVEMFGDLGVNPKRWRSIKMKEGCQSDDDIKCGPFGTQLAKSDYQKSGIPLWGIPQINSAFKKDATDYLTEEKANELDAYSIIPGDIAMSRKGNVGMCAVYPMNFPKGVIHSDILRIRLDPKKFNSLFMMYQLHLSPRIQRQISIVSHGAIMAGINVTKLKEIFVMVPPLSLQSQFASFVQQVESTKSTLTRSLTELTTLKKKLMQEYFG